MTDTRYAELAGRLRGLLADYDLLVDTLGADYIRDRLLSFLAETE